MRFIILLPAVLLCNTWCHAKENIYIAGFWNLLSSDGLGNLPAVRLAVQHINNNNSILRDYNVSLLYSISTKGDIGKGSQLLHDYYHDKPRKLMFIAPAQNDLSKVVAAFGGGSSVGIPQISYSEYDPVLTTNRALYPLFYSLIVSFDTMSHAVYAMVDSFNWTGVAIIYQNDNTNQKINDGLVTYLKKKGITVSKNVGFSSDPSDAVRQIKDSGNKHIIANIGNTYAKQVFCQVYKKGLYGGNYMWIITGNLGTDWYIPSGGDVSCSECEMKLAVRNLLFVEGASNSPNTATLSGQTQSQILTQYNSMVASGNRSPTKEVLLAYDSVLVIADVLSRSMSTLNATWGSNVPYGNSTVINLLQNKIESTNIVGASGPIELSPNGTRKSSIQINQMGSSGVTSGGTFNPSSGTFILNPSAVIPGVTSKVITHTETVHEKRHINFYLFVFWCYFCATGVLYALVCFVALIFGYKDQLIYNSCPLIGMLIILGCILNYIAVVLYGIDYSLASFETTDIWLCWHRLALLTYGFTFSIGGLLVKLWMGRRNSKSEEGSSTHLTMQLKMVIILIILFILDSIFLMCWVAIHPLKRTWLYQHHKEKESDTSSSTSSASSCQAQLTQTSTTIFITERYVVVEHCRCGRYAIYLGCMLFYKIVVLIVTCVFAFLGKDLEVERVNDTRRCAICVLVAAIFSVLGLLITLLIEFHPSAHYGIFGIFIIIVTTVILVLLFYDKIKACKCGRGCCTNCACGSCGTCGCGSCCNMDCNSCRCMLCSCCSCQCGHSNRVHDSQEELVRVVHCSESHRCQTCKDANKNHDHSPNNKSEQNLHERCNSKVYVVHTDNTVHPKENVETGEEVQSDDWYKTHSKSAPSFRTWDLYETAEPNTYNYKSEGCLVETVTIIEDETNKEKNETHVQVYHEANHNNEAKTANATYDSHQRDHFMFPNLNVPFINGENKGNCENIKHDIEMKDIEKNEEHTRKDLSVNVEAKEDIQMPDKRSESIELKSPQAGQRETSDREDDYIDVVYHYNVNNEKEKYNQSAETSEKEGTTKPNGANASISVNVSVPEKYPRVSPEGQEDKNVEVDITKETDTERKWRIKKEEEENFANDKKDVEKIKQKENEKEDDPGTLQALRFEEDKKIAEMKIKRKQEEEERIELEKKKQEEVKRKDDEQKKRAEEEQKRTEEEKKRAEEAKRKAEEERENAEEERKRAEEESRAEEEERKRKEEERQKTEDEERKKAEEERKREEETIREEKKRVEEERKWVEDERNREKEQENKAEDKEKDRESEEVELLNKEETNASGDIHKATSGHYEEDFEDEDRGEEDGDEEEKNDEVNADGDDDDGDDYDDDDGGSDDVDYDDDDVDEEGNDENGNRKRRHRRKRGNVNIINDKKDYSNVRSKLYSTTPGNNPKRAPKKITNKKENYSNAKSRLFESSDTSNKRERRPSQTNRRVFNKRTDYSKVRSKLY